MALICSLGRVQPHPDGGASLFLGWLFRLFQVPEMLSPFKQPLSIKTVPVVSVKEDSLSKNAPVGHHRYLFFLRYSSSLSSLSVFKYLMPLLCGHRCEGHWHVLCPHKTYHSSFLSGVCIFRNSSSMSLTVSCRFRLACPQEGTGMLLCLPLVTTVHACPGPLVPLRASSVIWGWLLRLSN